MHISSLQNQSQQYTRNQEQTTYKIKKMASQCPGKNSWPELLGTKGDRAVIIIERENHLVTATLVPEGTGVTADFRCDRVRVWINDKNIIERVPMIG